MCEAGCCARQESARHKQQLQSLESAKAAERKSTSALEAKVAEFDALQAPPALYGTERYSGYSHLGKAVQY